VKEPFIIRDGLQNKSEDLDRLRFRFELYLRKVSEETQFANKEISRPSENKKIQWRFDRRSEQTIRSTTNVRRSGSRKDKVRYSNNKCGCNLRYRLVEKKQTTI
jgi:hypothetical protein